MDLHKLYFPTLHESHYFLFVMDIKGRTFNFLDSYYDEHSSYHKNIKKKIIQSFICIWYEAQFRPMNFNTFTAVYPKVPQQDNEYKTNAPFFVIFFFIFLNSFFV